MVIHRIICIAALLTVACSGEVAGRISEYKAHDRETVERVRDVGHAMFGWLTDNLIVRERGSDTSNMVDWSRCPSIAHEELEEMLVPNYIEDLPLTDGWGYSLEYCLDREPTSQRYLVGIRSPGRDGTFDGNVYEMGGYRAGEFDRDVVWMDGYFMTYPSKDAD